MAGFDRIYVFGGLGGFQGADGVNPIAMQIWIGWGDRKWLEAHYFVDDLKPIAGIKSIVPKKPDEELNLLEATIIFAPTFFIDECDLMDKTINHFEALDKNRIDLYDDAPEFWDDMVEQAHPIFKKLNIFQSDLREINL